MTSITDGGRADAPALAPLTTPTRRFIAFLFDDRHLSASDFIQVQKAANLLLERPLADSDRAVILSISGVNSGMTHDRRVLQSAVMKMKAPTLDEHPCPDISHYSADQIINKHSDLELRIAMTKIENCTNQNGDMVASAAEIAAAQSLATGERDAHESLEYIGGVVRALSKLPGRRTLLLVSPGFLCASNDTRSLETQTLELAASSDVTINVLDARGLSSGILDAKTSDVLGPEARQTSFVSQQENRNVLAELSDGSGGTFFHNNDLEGGLRKLIEGPEYLYVLEVSLQDVKPDGMYHSLKVEVDQSGLKLQARRGYFAPLPAKSKK